MNDPERYELVFNPATQQPIGVTDLWQPGAMSVADMPPQQAPIPVQGPVYRPIPVPVRMPVSTYRPAQFGLPSGLRVRAYLYGAAVLFAAGLFVGCWLFGTQREQPATVVVCPAPGVQVAARPAECGPPAGGEPR